MKALSVQFDEMIIFGGVVFFFNEILEFLHKIKYFQYINILHNIFKFYCQHQFNHELSVFMMDKSMYCTLS